MEPKYYLQIDIIKALAIISVIILHTLPSTMSKSLIGILTIYQAVPIFFIIMGRNSGSSLKRKNEFSLNKLYSKSYFKSRFTRLIVPFIIIFTISLIIGLFLNKNIYLGSLSFLGYLPLTGPGNYYISIIFQFIIIFPIIYSLYRANPKLVIILGILISLFFELISPQIGILQNNSYIYKACILRYLFAIILGIWFIDNFKIKKVFNNKYFLLSLIVGIGYIISYSLFSFEIPYFITNWQPQNFLTFAYALFLCVLGINYLPAKVDNFFTELMKVIGKASYHIFLIQILFFGADLSLLSLFNLSLFTWNAFALGMLALAGNLIIILIIGLLFFYFETKITNEFFKT